MKAGKGNVMKKALSLIVGAAAALIMGAFSAAAEDVSIDVKFAEATDNGVSYSLNSNRLAASQFKEDTTLTVTVDGASGDECPIKLVLNYWNTASEANKKMGEPASAEVALKEYKDGKATYTCEDITKALNGIDPNKVYSIDVVANGQLIACTNIEATDVYSAAEAAEMGLLHTVHAHTDAPVTSSNWGQSLTVGVDQFDTSTLTKDSIAIAIFESDIGPDTNTCPVELILQSTNDTVSPKAKKGTVWAKVVAVRYSDSFAAFQYPHMASAYGTEDFSCVSTVYVGDTGKCSVTCSDLYVLDCKTLPPLPSAEPEESSKAEESKSGPAVTEAAASSSPEQSSAAAPAAVTSGTDNSASSNGEGSASNSIIFIIIGIVAGIVIAVVVVFIILTKKASTAYDVNSHKYIKK